MKLVFTNFINKKQYLVFYIFVFIALLSVFGIKGTFSRYAQDDYCYGYRVNENGFFRNQFDSYFNFTEYSSNRYSLTLFNNIAELLGGSKFVPYLPGIMIITWGLALFYLISRLVRPLQYHIFIVILSALVILFFSLYLSPNPYQNLYWLSAINPYLTPVVLATFILGCIFNVAIATKFSFLNALELIILSWLAGGFSEAAAVWLLSIWGIVFTWLFLFKRGTLFQKLKIPLMFVLISTLLAIVILLVCPTNAQESAHFNRPGFGSAILQSLKYGWEFIRVSVKVTPLPFAVVFSYGVWLGTLSIKQKISNRNQLPLHILSTTIIVFLLSVSTVLPSVYVTGSYPGDRALFPARFTLFLGMFVIGWLIALAFFAMWKNISNTFSVKIFLFIMGVLLLAYTVRANFKVTNNLDKFQARAQAWDIRQQIILDAKAAGDYDITVPQFDSMYGITELKPDPNNWVNICAAKYYGVNSITAVEGFMGIPAHPIGK